MDYHKTIRISKAIRDSIVFRHGRGDNSLPRTVQRLFALLEKREIEHLLVGGLALLQYVRVRHTEDIDLIISEDSLKKLSEVEIIEQEKDFIYGRFGGLELTFFLSQNPLFEKVIRECATNQRFEERPIPCATVKGLLLLKMHALPALYREGNFARTCICETDIAALTYYYKPRMPELFEELSPYLNAKELDDLKEAVEDIEARIERFRKSFRWQEEETEK